MFTLLVVPDIQQNYAIEIGSFSVLNFRISFSSFPVCRFALIKLLGSPFFAYIYLYFALISTTLSPKCQMAIPDFHRFPAKFRK